MVVLLTCKIEEDPINNRGARVFTTLNVNFADAQGQVTLELVVVSDRNLNSSKPFMHVLVTCKNDDDRFKNVGARVFTRFLPL